jgi:hypothetical protein
VIALVVLMIPVLWSYTRALTGPGNDSLGARSVEWLRGHHLSALVNWAEQINYHLHPPRKGGTPAVKATPAIASTVAPPTTPAVQPTPATTTTVAPATTPATSELGVPSSTASAPSTAVAPPSPPSPTTVAPPTPAPAPLTSPASPALPNEGRWIALGPSVNGTPGAYVTEIRPDAVHTSYLDAVVWLDPRRLLFRQFPGTFLPGSPWDRPPSVPNADQPALVAAFEGGFRPADSRGGMLLGGRTLLPLRAGAATLGIRSEGTVNVGRFGTDITGADGYDSLRQNLDLIVDGGRPVPELSTDPNRVWGFTGPHNNQFVWRSGVGVTASGAVVWVGGPALDIKDLAQTLANAGAVRAMQLDINQEWVQFNTYAVGADGVVHGTKLLSGMGHSADRYLSTDSRDFIAVFARPTPLG